MWKVLLKHSIHIWLRHLHWHLLHLLTTLHWHLHWNLSKLLLWHHHWKHWLLELRSNKSWRLFVSVKQSKTINLAQFTHIAILSMGEVVIKTLLTSPVSNYILLLFTVLLLNSVIKAFVVFDSTILLANACFQYSFCFLNVFRKDLA